jgi:hypothetical protein
MTKFSWLRSITLSNPGTWNSGYPARNRNTLALIGAATVEKLHHHTSSAFTVEIERLRLADCAN